MSPPILTFGESKQWPPKVVIYTDGASRGNPGPASLGFTVSSGNGETVFEYGEAIGEQTNNVAEYTAVLRALDLAVRNGVKELELRSDSQLLVRQLAGIYKVKAEGLKPLFLECLSLARRIPKIQFTHVPREENRRADELANMALDSGF